jgi:membrane protein
MFVRRTKKLFSLLREASQHWMLDHAPRLAAALSYYAIFSLAPALILITGFLGLIVDQNAVEIEVYYQIQKTVGADAATFVEQLLINATNWENSWVATGLGVATLLFGASGAFAELQGALNTIWGVRVKPKQGVISFLRTRLFSFIMLLIVGFMLLLSLVIDTWLVLIDKWLSQMLPELHLLFNVGNAVVSFAVIMLLFALLYKIVPDVKIRWHDIWVGAAVTAGLFNLGKWIIGLYLGNTTIARTFGAAGALVALLIWVNYSCQIILFGGEFIKVFATRRGRAVLPASHAINITWTSEDATLVD